jgi:ATP-dependent Clp protease ATP-binding subunit ClpC
MFGDQDALITLDMSEYMEKHNVSRLIGAPPGYVGYEEGGQLTEKIRRRPYAVLLLDEIEKAHPDVFNMLLQVMEEGRLTDSYGRNIDFRNTIVIMTTNVGAHAIKNEAQFGLPGTSDDASFEGMKERVQDEIGKAFRPEFINRLTNEPIIFRHLEKKDLVSIVQLELSKVRERLTERGYYLALSEPAVEFLIKKGTNLDMGARPMRRALENYIEDPLSEELLQGSFEGKTRIFVDVVRNDEGKVKHLKFEGQTGEAEPAAAAAGGGEIEVAE